MHSKYAPARLRERYDEVQKDPELVSLRGEIAMAELRIQELAQRLGTGESSALWARLLESYQDLAKAMAKHDLAAMNGALVDLRQIIEEGAGQQEVWKEFIAASKDKKELCQQEWKRLVDMNQVITAERARIMVGILTDIFLRHTPEPERRQAVAMEIYKFLDRPARLAEDVLVVED
jgi:hypothetical protein